jgi:hypothetical protein
MKHPPAFIAAGGMPAAALPFLERPDSCAAVVARTLESWNSVLTRP